jgi:hypothetical protein
MKNFTQILISLCFLLTITVSAQSSDCVPYNQSYDVVNYFDNQIGEYWNSGTFAGQAILSTGVPGYLMYGQNLLNADDIFSGGLRTVNFELLIANNSGADDVMFTIDILDWTAGAAVVSQNITRSQFNGSVVGQNFSLNYNHTQGNNVEYRVHASGIEICAVTGLSITNDGNQDGNCDCFGDTDGDGVCNEFIYSTCSDVDVSLFSASMSFNGSNYFLSSGAYTWEEANALAIAQGGHLVTINSVEENIFVQGLSSGSPWIGLHQNTNSPNYSEPSGGWEWITGECLDYENWSTGEPNEASDQTNGEGYAHMTSYGTWNDWESDASSPFIMEINCLNEISVCPIPGCMDNAACNYNTDANTDDGTCEYPVTGFDCEGVCLTAVDCNGDCGGIATEDNCGTCDADASNDCTQDCAEIWGGEAVSPVVTTSSTDINCDGLGSASVSTSCGSSSETLTLSGEMDVFGSVLDVYVEGQGWISLFNSGSETMDLEPGTYNYNFYINNNNVYFMSASLMIGDLVLNSYDYASTSFSGTFTIEDNSTLTLSGEMDFFGSVLDVYVEDQGWISLFNSGSETMDLDK